MRRVLLSAILLAAAAAAGGCGDPTARILRVDPGGYHVRGDYIGAQRRVKLFVERLHGEPVRSGRGMLLVAKLALLNERAEPVMFDCTGAHANIGVGHTPAVETHTIRIDAGELRRITLSFKTGEALGEVEGGVLDIEGIGADSSGTKTPAFHVPFSATEIEVKAVEKE